MCRGAQDTGATGGELGYNLGMPKADEPGKPCPCFREGLEPMRTE